MLNVSRVDVEKTGMARVWSIGMAEQKIADVVRLEPALALVALAFAVWVAYKIFLRKVSYERHLIFRDHFRNLAAHMVFGLGLLAVYQGLDFAAREAAVRLDFSPYLGFLALVWACVVLVKILRILAYEYLFLTSMKAGVPLLLVNILTLVLSIACAVWIMTRFFGVNLTPLLATSAIFSVVLGFALQDTLGNLFAAVALQIDKPFELGDWIEVRNGSDKVGGQVLEMSWRATMLLAITDEIVMIPNRSMAQAQISNFAGRKRPFVRSHLFRLPYDSNMETAKAILLNAASSVPGIASNPPPVVIAIETNESGLAVKVVYNIADYAAQFGIADRFLTMALKELREAGITPAPQRIYVERDGRNESSAA